MRIIEVFNGPDSFLISAMMIWLSNKSTKQVMRVLKEGKKVDLLPAKLIAVKNTPIVIKYSLNIHNINININESLDYGAD